MGYTGNNHYAQKYDASKAYDKDLTASARLHYLENSEHDKHDHPAKMCGPGNHAPKMHGSMKGDQSDQHIDYKNYKGTDKGYHGSTGSSHGDQSNIFHDYDKHPAKMYGEPAAKFNSGLREASDSGKLDNNPKLSEFAKTLERVCIQTVESGKMTKDLALLISKDAPWLNTQEFLAAIDDNLKKEMA